MSAEAHTPEYDAVNSADAVVVTVPAVNVNTAEVLPDGIMTDDGTWTVVLEEDSETAIPLLPAGAFRVIVPVPDWPPTRESDESGKPLMAGGAGSPVTHTPLRVAAPTRTVTCWLQTSRPRISAVHCNCPRIISVAVSTSVKFTNPSWFRSQGLVCA